MLAFTVAGEAAVTLLLDLTTEIGRREVCRHLRAEFPVLAMIMLTARPRRRSSSCDCRLATCLAVSSPTRLQRFFVRGLVSGAVKAG